MSIKAYLQRFLPDQPATPPGEMVRGALGVGLGVGLVLAISAWGLNSPVLVVASVGASAVLVFCLPASPLAQPWPVAGGYLVCALAGVLAAQTGLATPLAAGLAVALAVLGMLMLRCLHPPGGAVALFAVIGGPGVQALGFQYALTPVLANALVLVAAGLAINNLIPGRHYPRKPQPTHAHPTGFTADDLRAALAEYPHPLDVSGEELDELLDLAEARARQHRTGPARH